MKIFQLTDLHLPTPLFSSSDSVPLWQKWRRFLQDAEKGQPDLCIITGDICQTEPDRKVYQRLAQDISSLSFPIYFLPGNHDDAQLMKDELNGSVSILQSFVHSPFYIFMLNTQHARLRKEEVQQLQEHLTQESCPTLLFMHHPPLYAGNPHMDQSYPFQQIDTLWPILRQSKNEVHIFCGHYHMERTLIYRKVHVHITPSPYFSIDPSKKVLQTEKVYGTPYRDIRLINGQLHQSLCWIKG